MNLKLSIITPTLNQGKYIRDTIESVLSQNNCNIEHIVIDGGSKDNTLQILKEYKHLKWISEPDSGPANAINKGIEMANGEILTWINSDDYYEKDVLGNIVNVFNKNPEIKLVYGNLTFVNLQKKVLKIDKTEKYDLFTFIHKNADSVRQPCTFFSKSLYLNVGGLNEKLKYVFDYDLFIKMLMLVNPYYINENIAFYREYNETLTRKNLRKQGMEIIKIARKYGAKLWDEIIIKSIIKKILFSKLFYLK
jgi:glycosyltransferase involved in cell wall biosynthesis